MCTFCILIFILYIYILYMCIYVTGVPEEPLEPGSSRSEIKSHNSEGEAEDDEYIFV